MKKFLFFLFICMIIVAINCAGKDEAGPSERQKGKRQMEEHSDSENSANSNSNDIPQELISNPAVHGNLEDVNSPDMNWWLNELESANDENMPHSPTAQHQMEHHHNPPIPLPSDGTSNQPIQLIEEQDHSEKIHAKKKYKKWPRQGPPNLPPNNIIKIDATNFGNAVRELTGQPVDPKQVMPMPYHQSVQHSPGSSLATPTLPANISDEQQRKVEADFLHNFYQKLADFHGNYSQRVQQQQQQHSAGQPIHQLHQQGQQQIVRPIPRRIDRNNNPSTNPGQSSSHRTLPPIPQSVVHSGTNLLQQEKEQQEEQHQQFWQEHPQLVALKGSLITAEQKLIELRIEDDQMVNQTLQYEMWPSDEFIQRRIHLSNQISQFEDMKRQILQQILEYSTI